VPKNALLRLIAITRSNWASVVSSTEVLVSIPALFTITSTRPKAVTVESMSRWRSSSLLTSASTPSTLSPSAVTWASSASVACSSATQSMTTVAPAVASASTIALPMPLLPPVTMATLPCRAT
jgi:hypothetical protein